MTDLRNLKAWVRNQLPAFVSEGGYEKFIALLQAYYDFLEQDSQVHDLLFKINDVNDVDLTIDAFIDSLAKSFACYIPPRHFVSKRDAIKHVKEIYSVKGTPTSYHLLFQLLFEEAIDLYYPEEDILRLSSQNWGNRKALVYHRNIPLSLDGVMASTAGASFVVDQTTNIDPEQNLYRVDIDARTIEGTVSGSILWSTEFPDQTAQILLSAVDAKITSAGTGYDIGDLVITQVSGRKITIQIAEVDPEGGTRRIQILNQTYTFDEVSSTVTNTPSGGSGTGLTVEISFGAIFNLNNNTTESRHQLSGQSKLQDGIFYSPYTVVIKSGIDSARWKKIVTSLIHPAGIGLFAQILISSIYRKNLEGASIAIKSQIFRKVNSHTSHRNYGWFERVKFLTPPYERGIAGTANVWRDSSEMYYLSTNPTYVEEDYPEEGYTTTEISSSAPWSHQTMTISLIADIPIGHITHEPDRRKTNVQPGSFVAITLSDPV